MSASSRRPEDRDDSDITVLFVDEDRDFLDLASRLLELETDRIDLVLESSPRAALDRLQKLDIDCVVSDYRMTELDGVELLERVRSEHPRVPFILFTGRGGEQIASDAISAGATDYIVKTGSPDQYTVLANRIEKAVSRTRAQARTIQQEHLDSIVRTITNELIHQETRARIEQTACEKLIEIEPYGLVQISRPTGDDPPVRPHTWAVDDAADIDPGAAIDVVGGDVQSPERTAYETGRTVAVNETRGESRFEQWRSSIEGSNLESVLCVPITYEDISYGVISIYAAVPGVFSGVKFSIIRGLGELIGFAISSAELRQGMFSGTMTEIELTVRDPSAGLVRLARELETTVRLETLTPRSDGRFSMSLVIEDPPAHREHVEEVITGVFSTDETTVSGDEDGRMRLAVVVETSPVDVVEGRGIRIKHVVATGETGQIVLAAPPDIDVRDVVEIAESQFETVELTARRTLTDQQRSASTGAGIGAELTPRQREVLETAWRNGFFEWPRAMNTEEIASLLGMSQPALSRHLRNIQRTIAESVVDEIADSSGAD